MAASKSNGPRAPADVTPQSNSKPTSTTANKDGSWDWDGYSLGPTNPPSSSADVTIDPIFGSFDHRRSGSNSSVDPVFGAFDHRNGSKSSPISGDVAVDPIFGAFDRKGSKDFGDFDLMSAGGVGDVFENHGMAREKKAGGFDELVSGFGVTESSLGGSGGDYLENLGRSVPEKVGRKNVVDSGFDELIPGMGGSSSNQGRKFSESYSPMETTSGNTNGITVEDPLVNFESSSAPPSSSSGLFADLLNDSPVSANSGSPNVDFSTSHPMNHFDGVQDPTSFFPNGINVAEMKSKTNPGNSASERRPSNQTSTMNFLDDLNFDLGEFQEADSKSEERGKNKIDRDLETRIRVAKALDDKKQRDMQIQREQDEKHRIAEKLDFDIKRWSAGKEGNLRALLSSLQGILGPESGWQPVSLTDLITAQAVKKVYKKATLYIHPDKMQQRGATLHQKFVAEKVFDIIKEAYKKFESEELF